MRWSGLQYLRVHDADFADEVGYKTVSGEAVDSGGFIKLLDLASWKHVRTIELPEMTLREFGPGFERQPNADKKAPVQITALAFSPDGSTLAVGNKGPLRLVKMNPR